MAVHNSLILGPNARGSIGGTHTFCNVKGVGVMKAKSNPSNPQTTGQTTQRNNFSSIVLQWHDASMLAVDKEAWRNRATKQARGLSGWNMFMSLYRKWFATGNTLVYLTGITATVGAPNVVFAGDISSNDDLKITVLTETGVFAYSTVVTAALGAFTKDIPLADVPSSGWIYAEVTTALHGGACGIYHYSV